jgi:hypothetical protein
LRLPPALFRSPRMRRFQPFGWSPANALRRSSTHSSLKESADACARRWCQSDGTHLVDASLTPRNGQSDMRALTPGNSTRSNRACVQQEQVVRANNAPQVAQHRQHGRHQRTKRAAHEAGGHNRNSSTIWTKPPTCGSWPACIREMAHGAAPSSWKSSGVRASPGAVQSGSTRFNFMLSVGRTSVRAGI